MSHAQRVSISEVDKGSYQAALSLQKYVNGSSLEKRLIAFVDIRASQLNHCAWCLDMHASEARETGASQRQIDLIVAWEDAGPLFSDREQAALAFTEQVTLISEQGVTDEVWARARAAFSEQEIVELLMTIAAINVWNRINVTARTALPAK